MKILITLIIALATFNIQAGIFGDDAKPPKGLELTCIKVGGNIIRCENREVICYAGQAGYSGVNMGDSGMHCQFKEKK